MARIRTIKPSFFRSRTVDKLTYEQRLTFIGLWTHVDDAGRCEFDLELIKADIWPRDRSTEDIGGDILALTEVSLIVHYVVDERSFLAVSGWAEHQKINRPTESKIPAPDSTRICPLTSGNDDSVKAHGALMEVSRLEGKGKEGKGKNILATATRRAETDETFDAFWEAYPRKVGKEAARKAWTKATRSTDADDILAGAKRYAAQRSGEDSQYTAHPASWLNAGRWQDEPVPAAANDWRRYSEQ